MTGPGEAPRAEPYLTTNLSEPPDLGLAEGGVLARATGTMTAFTGVSRITGFVRILVATGVLGTTALGNTYDTANSVPNILFELFATGALQAVLIPTLVELLDKGDDDEARHVAGSVLGLTCGFLAVLGVMAAALAPLLAHGVFAGVQDPVTRHEQVQLGTIFLWFFIPQVIFYAAGMVATAVLNARYRFALPTIAPLANNVIVIASYLIFNAMRQGEQPSLHLTVPQILVLAGGTTLGVIVFCGLPVVAVIRSGFSLRPRFDRHHPAVRHIGRLGGWAAMQLATTQVLLIAILVLSNRVTGGEIAYEAAFRFFLLPHALLTLPILTALFPALSRRTHLDDWSGFTLRADQGLRAILYFVAVASAALTALGPLLARTLLAGHVHNGGSVMIGRTIVAFGPGLLGYGLFLFASRLQYARADTRTSAWVNVGVVVAGILGMVVVADLVRSSLEVPGLAAVHSVVYTLGAVVLLAMTWRSFPAANRPRLGVALRSSLIPAIMAGGVMAVIGRLDIWDGRVRGLVGILVAGGLGLGVYLVLSIALGGPRPGSLVRMVRGTELPAGELDEGSRPR